MATMNPGKVQIYQSKSGPRSQRWRWRVKARNGKVLCDSAEGYANKGDLCEALRLVAVILIMR